MRRRLFPGLFLLAVLAFAAGARADAPAPWPVSSSGAIWFRLTMLGQPVGYASSAWRVVHDEQGVERLQETDRMVISITQSGQTMRLIVDEVDLYARDLSQIHWDAREDANGLKKEIAARSDGKTLRLSTVEAGQRHDQALPLPADFSSDLSLRADILKGALKPGDTRTYTTLDLPHGTIYSKTTTVGQPETLQVMGQPQRCWPLVVVDHQDGSETRDWLNDQGETVKSTMPALMDAVAEEVSQAEALRQFTPLEFAGSLALDKTLPPSPGLRRLVLRAKGLTQAVAGLIPAGPRQDVVVGPEGTAQVTIRAQATPAHTLPLPVPAQGMEEYLKPTPMAPSDDLQLQALARKIVGPETDSYRAALALNAWVNHTLSARHDPYRHTALQVLKKGGGDCEDYAVLMVTLGRALGLPTRMVTGLMADANHLYGHAWVEVYVGEWVETDPMWGEAGVDAGHLALGRSALDDVSLARMVVDFGRIMSAGGLTLSVVEWQ